MKALKDEDSPVEGLQGKDHRANLRFKKYTQLVAKLATIKDTYLDMSELDLPIGIKFDTKSQKITYGGNGFGLSFAFEVFSEADQHYNTVVGHIKGHPTNKNDQDNSDLCNFHVKVEKVNRAVVNASRYFGPLIPNNKTADEVAYDELAESQCEIHAAVKKLGDTIIDLVYNHRPQHDVDVSRSCDLRVKLLGSAPPAAPPVASAVEPAGKASQNGFFAGNGGVNKTKKFIPAIKTPSYGYGSSMK